MAAALVFYALFADRGRTAGSEKGLFSMETGFLKSGTGSFAAVWILVAAALLGAARMGGGLQEKTIVKEEGNPGFSDLTARAEGTVEAIQEKNGRVSVQLKHVQTVVRKTDEAGQQGKREYALKRLLVYLPPEDMEIGEILPGMKILCTGELERFEPARNEGEFDYRLYYRSRDICCRMSAKKAEITEHSVWLLQAVTYRIREQAKKLLEQYCTETDAGLLAAVLLGDKTRMNEEINELYQKNGIAHLLAVSGLHISLIGMGVYRLLRRLGLGFGAAGFWAGGLLFVYGTMTGFGPSVFRACLMLACSFWAAYLGRTYDLLSAMALAAVCLSLENPFVIFTGAFQLSFGAVFAIGWAGTELADRLRCQKSWEKALAVSLAIQLVTGPIVLYHFFEYPLYGIFLNFLVIPLMTYVAGAGMAGLLMGMAGVFAVSFIPGPTALFLKKMLDIGAVGSMGTCHYIFMVYEMLCRAAERLPGSSLILGRPELWKLAAYYIVLAAFLACSGKRERDRVKENIKIWGFLISLLSFLLYRPVSGLRVDFIDVGQGDVFCWRQESR